MTLPAGGVTIYTYNTTPNNVWITIYDLAKTKHLDWGNMDPQGSREWTSGNYSQGAYYHVRGEVKNSDGCTIYDTSIQVVAQNTNNIYVTLHQGPSNYYWSNDDQPSKTGG